MLTFRTIILCAKDPVINAPTIKKAATSKTKRQRQSLKQSNNNVVKRCSNKCSANLQLKNKEGGKCKTDKQTFVIYCQYVYLNFR